MTLFIGFFVFFLFILPALILSLEPNEDFGNFYRILAHRKYQAGKVEEAKKHIELSLENNPYSQEAKDFSNKINQ